ncbi:T9SS type A sorting domain-containing protein [Hymenobacter sp.]|uniref:T9SS type A sorting domain-containing protein n=1 Tax=Hymenobacter sp. TaxID=1898978 RepID=UPI00286C5C16|nr:T9SS type A sorting domain-containing protein [Hymenobacter sp.]
MKHVFSLRMAGLLAGLFFALASPTAAQAPAWQSARVVAAATAAVTGNFSYVRATAVDAAGNVYLAGYFANSVVLGGTTLTSVGGDDVFVAKFSPVSNQFVWARRAGGSSDDQANALAVNGTSVYLAGEFRSPTASFGATTLANAGSADVFVAKLTDAGSTSSFTWAQRAGGLDNDLATALAVRGTSVYVAGEFRSFTASFGATILINVRTAAFTSDAYVAKLTDAGPTGSFAWAQRAGGQDNDSADALAVNGASVYMAGEFRSSSVGFGSTNLTNTGINDAYVAKLTDAGSTSSFVWAQRAGSIGDDQANALAVSGNNVYVAGYFGGLTAGFGTTTLVNANTTGNSADAYVAKLADAGSTSSFVWAQRAGGTGNDRADALAVNGTSVYVSGAFISSTAAFGATTLANANTAGGSADAYVAKLADAGPTGSFAWAQRGGGAGNEYAFALALSGSNVYVAGYFNSPTASFGATTISNPNTNTILGFLASLTDPTLTATATAGPREPAALFPNPARHTATLRLPTGTPGAPLTLTDALGRAVRRYPAPAGPETVLDLGGLPAGLYLLRGAGPARRLAVE